MRTVVSVQEISEFEIRPASEVVKWRALVEAEIHRWWADRSDWISIDCPACLHKDVLPAFERFGIAYGECKDCGALYAPLRPSEDALWRWYRELAPARFWREKMLPASEATRRDKIILPRADWILDGIAEFIPNARRLIDISPHGRGLLNFVAKENFRLKYVVAAGMTADLDGAPTARIQTQPTHVADLPGLGPADVIIAIDVLDRAVDLTKLREALSQMLTPGGVIFATAPVASGFEVQTLWERSPTVIPPDKLNLPTVAGLQRLFAAPAWELLELSTPGMFDVEMVYRAIKAEPDAAWPRVVRALVERTDINGRTALVELLQAQRLTSFARLVIRKAG